MTTRFTLRASRDPISSWRCARISRNATRFQAKGSPGYAGSWRARAETTRSFLSVGASPGRYLSELSSTQCCLPLVTMITSPRSEASVSAASAAFSKVSNCACVNCCAMIAAVQSSVSSQSKMITVSVELHDMGSAGPGLAPLPFFLEEDSQMQDRPRRPRIRRPPSASVMCGLRSSLVTCCALSAATVLSIISSSRCMQ
mmetsp:Transcript_39067/g.103239  ORF Transcript_39067/g.103239 Transcript_39067/m.103239 type:complete len:200 (+) Transcript_39067:465-1064(+)